MPHEKVRAVRKKVQGAKKRLRSGAEKTDKKTRLKRLRKKARSAQESLQKKRRDARKEARLTKKELGLLGRELGVQQTARAAHRTGRAGVRAGRRGVAVAERAGAAAGGVLDEFSEATATRKQHRDEAFGSPLEQQIQDVDSEIAQLEEMHGGFRMDALDIGTHVEEPLLFEAIDPVRAEPDGDLFDVVMDPVEGVGRPVDLDFTVAEAGKAEALGTVREVEKDISGI